MSGNARQAIVDAPDDAFGEPWSLERGDEALFTAVKAAVLRRFAMGHLVHHRGQLTVFLRLLDAHVPSVYGPSADEPDS